MRYDAAEYIKHEIGKRKINLTGDDAQDAKSRGNSELKLRKVNVDNIFQLRELITACIVKEHEIDAENEVHKGWYADILKIVDKGDKNDISYTEMISHFSKRISKILEERNSLRIEASDNEELEGSIERTWSNLLSNKARYVIWIAISGDISQTIAKTYAARAAMKRGTGAAWGQIAAGGLALASAFFPGFKASGYSKAARAAMTAAGVTRMATAAQSGRQAEIGYDALPYKEEVDILFRLGFNKIKNNGSSVFISSEGEWFPT